jgi:uncharacterized alkaline shock family protein YloU
MNVDKKTKYGKIDISLDAIASVAGSTVMNVFGVVGLGTKRSLSDNINVFLNIERYKDGVVVKKDKSGYTVSLYIIVAYGVKITEVIAEVQHQVKYYLSKAFDVKFAAINVLVQGVKRM